MSSAKLDAFNEFIAAARQLREHVVNTPEALDSGTSAEEIIRRDMGIRLTMVHAARKVSTTPADSEADNVAGQMLLERICAAVEVRDDNEWDALAQAAIDSTDTDKNVDQEHMTVWMDETALLAHLGSEALSRVEDQGIEAMLQGLREGAEQTPGMDFRFTETVDGQVIKDERVLGPNPGEEDTTKFGTGRLSRSRQAALGLDDDMTSVEVERVMVRESQNMLERHGLDQSASVTDMEAAVTARAYRELDRDFALAEFTGAVPNPLRGLRTEHFPALRSNVIHAYYNAITQGSALSRARRGDQSAQSIIHEVIVLASMLVSAEPYYLPTAQINAAPTSADRRKLPANATLLVWHDDPVPVTTDVRVLTWMFSTDEHGSVDDIAQIVMVQDDGGLDSGWCSLKSGQAAKTASAVASTLTARRWDRAKKLRLPGSPGSSEWKKTLVRSATRARRGGVHRLHTLADLT